MGAQEKAYKLPQGISKDDYSQQYVVVRLKNKISDKDQKARGSNPLSAYQTEQFLPYLNDNARSKNFRTDSHPLANLYKVKVEEGDDPVNVINELLKNNEVLYAEPYFEPRPLFIPDDPEAQPGGNLWYLEQIDAYDAWTIEKGDTSVIIGSLDTGILPEHFDLSGNIVINHDDPINGVDDDEDGLIDNLNGWDIADNDNNPVSDTDIHGHGVAGVSSASTNNGLGIAGVGFRSKFMPIKIFRSGSNSFSNGYEAIALAADLGCDVINLSWGSAGSFSNYGQDIINYAVEERDAVVVAAAGNTNAQLDFYPASFDNVLSVGATNDSDEKAGFATYSYKIDLMAPGQDIYVIDGDSVYSTKLGTSYSSPMVAGAAALVRARFPDLTAKQVMERIRVNTDDIYDIPTNQTFEGKLGSGRLNVFKALTNNINPSLRINDVSYSNGLGEYAFYGDTLTISINITNYLFNTTNATATISTTSPFVEILEGDYTIGKLSTFATTDNSDNPFRVRLTDNLPPDQDLIFRVDFTDGTYSDFQYFTIEGSKEYINIDHGNLELTAGSRGQLGYNADIFTSGVGMKYKGLNLLDNIGFIAASSVDTVKDTAPRILSINIRDQDFESLTKVKFYRDSEAAIDIRNVYVDDDDITNPLGLRVEQKILGWNTPQDSNYLVVEYRLINQGAQTVADLYSGIFADWNINDRNFNQAGWDVDNLLGFVTDPSDTLYTGIALLNSETPFYFAIDNKNANGNSADIASTINDFQKYNLVSNGIAKTFAGVNGGGNDVSHVIGYNVNNFGVNDAAKLALAIVVGESLQDLQNAVVAASNNYQNYILNPPILHVTEVCAGDPATINPPQGNIYAFYTDVTLSTEITTGSALTTPPVTSPQTYYAVNKDEGFDGDVFRVIAKPKMVNADFDFSSNPLLLDETGNTEVRFTDLSTDGISWNWDFDNGFTTTVQNPLMNFTKVGNYDIALTVINDIGCVEGVVKTLEVANRSNQPDISNQSICKGDLVSLTASNATNLKVYDDATLSNMIFSGTTFNSGNLFNDTTFYITSQDSVYESNPKAVNVTTSKIKAGFDYDIDTSDVNSQALLHFKNRSENEELYLFYVNGQLIGNTTEPSFDYSGLSSFEVKVLAEDINGCQDSIMSTITPKVSPTPSVTDMNLCENQSATISPGNGSIFYFYADQQLNDLQQKGSAIQLDNLMSDTTIYITAVDSLLESPAAAVVIDISEINAAFTISPDSLDIADINQITINNSSTGATDYTWYVNDSIVSTDLQPDLGLENIGHYDIKLEVSNATGCTSFTLRELAITNITRTDLSFPSIRVFPNPAFNSIRISSPTEVEYKLSGLSGTVHLSGKLVDETIDISQLPAGIYMLEISKGKEKDYIKILKLDR